MVFQKRADWSPFDTKVLGGATRVRSDKVKVVVEMRFLAEFVASSLSSVCLDTRSAPHKAHRHNTHHHTNNEKTSETVFFQNHWNKKAKNRSPVIIIVVNAKDPCLRRNLSSALRVLHSKAQATEQQQQHVRS